MPQGEALDQSNEEINEAALVGEQDVAEAQVWAREHLPGFLEGLAEADTITVAEVKELRRENDRSRL
jgi:hypothetical protein